MKMGEHRKLIKELFGHSIWFKCGTSCSDQEFVEIQKKNVRNCAHISNIRPVIQDHYVCGIEDLDLMLHGFFHTSYICDNAVHISGWIIPSLPADQEGVPKTSLWGRWDRSESEMGHWTSWVWLIAV